MFKPSLNFDFFFAEGVRINLKQSKSRKKVISHVLETWDKCFAPSSFWLGPKGRFHSKFSHLFISSIFFIFRFMILSIVYLRKKSFGEKKITYIIRKVTR